MALGDVFYPVQQGTPPQMQNGLLRALCLAWTCGQMRGGTEIKAEVILWEEDEEMERAAPRPLFLLEKLVQITA